MASWIFSTKSRVREVKLGSLKTATALQPCSMTAVCRELMRMHLVRRKAKPNGVKPLVVEQYQSVFALIQESFEQLVDEACTFYDRAERTLKEGRKMRGRKYDGDSPPHTRTCARLGSRSGS